ncbi:hypothetical protein GCM10023210_06670 [Chryseobacterium ginsengisoli]|uniref:Uncharacterized protein n=1 Tax=Chryseobacterium ginsengisoli TaxID=363853 RepID=A0ABP9LY87_9FLAO
MTKKLFAIALIANYGLFFSQAGINTSTPHASSALDVNSDTKGMLLPRLTTAAVTSLSSSASEGLIVFNKETKTFLGWDGTKWQNLGFEGSGTSGQTGTVFSQGFEIGSPVNYTISGFSPSSFSFTSGTTTISDAPSFSPLYSEGTRGFGYSNSTTGTVTSTYLEFNTVDASAYTNNLTLSFDLAAFSYGNTTNGLDNTDLITVEISTDSGATYATKLTLTGGNSSTGSNTRWAFSGTGSATNTFAASGITVASPNTTTGSGQTYTGNDAITKLSVTGIPNSNQLRFRIGARNNAATELWVIDNVKLQAL